ncbi:MAG TPA: hypothetical protein VNK05_14165 [Chloroflexota bacterium]|nr:hypothetical protein [Chloroflexota bacterium]
MPEQMWRVAKHEGVGNVVLEHVPVPQPGLRRGGYPARVPNTFGTG